MESPPQAMATQCAASIGDLPIELHEQILCYLPWQDQLNCEHVCKVWREVIRGRYSSGRHSTAPWLPQQNYDLAFYAPLQIHSLLVDGKTFSFKCRDGYTLSGSPYDFSDFVIDTLVRNQADGQVGFSQFINSLEITEKQAGASNGEGGSQGSTAAVLPHGVIPISNLSILNDMVVLPALVYEDEIFRFYCRYTRLANAVVVVDKPIAVGTEGTEGEGEGGDAGSSQDSSQASTDGSQPSADTSQAPADTSTPTRISVSQGNFMCDVHKDTDEVYFRLTLGKLLLEIRRNIIGDVFRQEGLDIVETENVDPDETVAQQVAKIERRKTIEDAAITIENFNFVKSGDNQALSAVFNAIVEMEAPQGEPVAT
ncbi:hypothetical protein DRE_00124 [Drechslerella stenobrocha 248]|uniref:F-box domain-containing protein n=1 Tax=Drechslerella stenobrocha 248 TaxID=1043628 RepID=W7HZ74_9PEZI|nr:hypothetical protein DRE_00124 [Drechslerella stenobrocha 248]